MTEPTTHVYLLHRHGLNGPEDIREDTVHGEVRIEMEASMLSFFRPGMIEIIPLEPYDRIVIRCARIG